jgi:hydrogenase maturation factor
VRQLFAARLMGMRPIGVNAQVIGGDEALQERVLAAETAVGFTMMGNVDGPAAVTSTAYRPVRRLSPHSFIR